MTSPTQLTKKHCAPSLSFALALKLVHLELGIANSVVSLWHRHHQPVLNHRFSLGAVKNGSLVGVAIVGRPVSRRRNMLRDLEVLRVSTNGTPNACSFLLGACAKAGKALGYSRIQTFTLESEGGGV